MSLKKVIIKVWLCIAVVIAVVIGVLFVAGVVLLFYSGYRCQRVPVYQTVMTDVEIVPQEENDIYRSSKREFQELIDKFDIQTLQCFIFQGHPQRPFYNIFLIGEIPAGTDFSELEPKNFPLKRNKMLFSALKLSGAEPVESEDCLDLSGFIWLFVYRNRIVVSFVSGNPTFLKDDAEKQAFLEKCASIRSKQF